MCKMSIFRGVMSLVFVFSAKLPTGKFWLKLNLSFFFKRVEFELYMRWDFVEHPPAGLKPTASWKKIGKFETPGSPLTVNPQNGGMHSLTSINLPRNAVSCNNV